MSLFSELRRREVLKMLALYVIGSWVVIQAADLFFPGSCIPESSIRHVWFTVVLGLPVALIFSWCFDISRTGVRRTMSEDRGVSSRTLVTVDFLLLSTLSILAIGIVGIQGQTIFATRDCGPIIADQTVFDPPDESIAVLPFVNMSEDSGNEYFSDGISVQILDLLTQMPELLVIQWPSVSFYKGKDIQFSRISRELNVAHILVGSVRKAGNQVRVTAQLIEARSEAGVWSATYDRELEDVFAIQDEVATAVVDSLKITLIGEKPKAVETNLETYRLYLQAKQFIRQRDPQSFDRVLPLLNKALRIDPDFAPAWAEIAAFHAFLYDQEPQDYHQKSEQIRQAARKTLELDPDNGLAYAMLALVEMNYDWNWDAAEDHINKALELEPANDRVLRVAARLSHILVQADAAITLATRAVMQDPINVTNRISLTNYLSYDNQLTEALEQLRVAQELMPNRLGGRSAMEGYFLLHLGDPVGALAAVENETAEATRLWVGSMVQHALGDTQASDAALEEMIEKYQEGWAYQIAMVYGFRNEPDSAFYWLERCYEQHDEGLPEMRRQPEFANMHDDPRWNLLLERIGFAK